MPDPVYGFRGGNFDKGIPVPEYLQQRDLGRAEALVAAHGAGGAADDADCAGIPRRSSRHSDALAARHLG
jgi:hypothetical protein